MKLLSLAARIAREGSLIVATLVAFTAGSVASAVPAGMNGNRPKAHDVSDLGIGALGIGGGALLVHGGIALAAGAGLAVGGGVVLGVLGVAAIGYGAYRVYKFFSKQQAGGNVVAPRPTVPGPGGITSPGGVIHPGGSNTGRGSDTNPSSSNPNAPVPTHGPRPGLPNNGVLSGGHGVHR